MASSALDRPLGPSPRSSSKCARSEIACQTISCNRAGSTASTASSSAAATQSADEYVWRSSRCCSSWSKASASKPIAEGLSTAASECASLPSPNARTIGSSIVSTSRRACARSLRAIRVHAATTYPPRRWESTIKPSTGLGAGRIARGNAVGDLSVRPVEDKYAIDPVAAFGQALRILDERECASQVEAGDRRREHSDLISRRGHLLGKCLPLFEQCPARVLCHPRRSSARQCGQSA